MVKVDAGAIHDMRLPFTLDETKSAKQASSSGFWKMTIVERRSASR